MVLLLAAAERNLARLQMRCFGFNMLYVVGGSCKVIALLTEKVGKVTSDGMWIIIRFISVTTQVFVVFGRRVK